MIMERVSYHMQIYQLEELEDNHEKTVFQKNATGIWNSFQNSYGTYGTTWYNIVINVPFLVKKVNLTDLGVSKHMAPDGVATLTYLAKSTQERKNHLKYLRSLS